MPTPHFSLILTGFEGRYGTFRQTVERELGRTGLDAFSLCVGKEVLPAEFAAGLSEPEAVRIAGLLQATGAQIRVVPTSEVAGVRFRAEECWASRSAGGFHFTEVEGMVLTLASVNARQNVRVLREREPEIRPWQIERSLNHQHPTHDTSREALRVAREFGDELAAALREAYPERSFMLDYLEEQVSFYQRGGDAPETPRPRRPRVLEETVYCEGCKEQCAYVRREAADPEFPNAEWADCAGCGAELLLRANEVWVPVPPVRKSLEETWRFLESAGDDAPRHPDGRPFVPDRMPNHDDEELGVSYFRTRLEDTDTR